MQGENWNGGDLARFHDLGRSWTPFFGPLLKDLNGPTSQDDLKLPQDIKDEYGDDTEEDTDEDEDEENGDDVEDPFSTKVFPTQDKDLDWDHEFDWAVANVGGLPSDFLEIYCKELAARIAAGTYPPGPALERAEAWQRLFAAAVVERALEV
jgi:hypothetical protein